jgi:hypothetical protein
MPAACRCRRRPEKTTACDQTPDIAVTKTMQAVVCHGPEDYRLEERPVPVPGPGEVVIKVRAR